MHWDSISGLATLGMWADPGSYAYADDQHEIDPEVCLLYTSDAADE